MNGRPIKLISDDPAIEDEFGTHAAVAEALAALVTEHGGKTIGLEGRWGSGKSTVVRLVDKQLSDDTHTVFVYDAWAHQDDPLRRSFLEELIADLSDKGWLKAAEWKDEVDKLAGRLTVVKVKTTPRLTVAGRLFALSAAVTPLSLVLLNHLLDEKNPSIGWLRAAWIGAASTLIVAVILTIASLFGSENWKREVRPTGLVTSSHIRDETKTSYSDGSPTSIEFEDLFRRLTKSALANSTHRLVIVLDNLDRIDPENALSVLATLRTFSPHGATGAADRVWTVVPYDGPGLRDLWHTESDDRADTAFLEKLFDVRLHVPPLIPSNWRGYLERLLREAIGDIQDQEVVRVAEVLLGWELRTGGRARRLTHSPRELKRFVNGIGGRLRTNPHVDVAAAATCELMEAEGTDIEADLRLDLGGKVPARVRTILGPSWRAQLAVALLGVPLAEARQLILEPEIERALIDADASKLAELAALDGFWEVLASSAVEAWAENGAINLLTAAGALDDAGLWDHPRAGPFTRTVLDVALSTAAFALQGVPSGAGLASLLNHGGSEAYAIWDRLQFGDLQAPPLTIATDVQYQLDGLLAFADAVSSPPTTQLNVRGDSEVFVRVCRSIGEPQGSALWPIVTTEDPSAAVEKLVEVSFTENYLADYETLEPFLAQIDNFDLTPLVDRYCQALESDEAQTTKYRAQALALLGNGDWSNHPAFRQRLQGLRDSFHLLSVMAFARNDGDQQSLGAAMLLEVGAANVGDTPAAERSHQEGFNLLQDLLSTPANHPDVLEAQRDLLLNQLTVGFVSTIERVGTVEWSKELLRVILATDSTAVRVDELLTHWSTYWDLLGWAPLRDLVRGYLAQGSGFLDNLIAREHSDVWAVQADIVLAALQDLGPPDHGPLMAKACGWAIPLVEAADPGAWSRALAVGSDPLVWATVRLARIGAPPKLGHATETGLVERAQAVLNGTQVGALPAEELDELLRCLEGEHWNPQVAKRVVDAAADLPAAPPPPFWTEFGRLIARDRGVLASSQLCDVLERVIRNREEAGLLWFDTTTASEPAWAQDLRQDLRVRLIPALQALAEEVPDSAQASAAANVLARLESTT